MIILLNISFGTLFCLGLGILGIILTIYVLASFSKAMKNIDSKNTTPVMATIIDNKRNEDGVYAAVYSYSHGSTNHTTIGPYKSLTPYNIGVQVEINVDPCNPHINSVKTEKTKNVMLIIILGLLGISVLFLFLGINGL